MTNTHTIVVTYPSHTEAERMVIELQNKGFDVQKLSIIGKDYRTTEHVRGFLTWQDMATDGARGAGYLGSFFGGLFGILAGAGVLFIPGVGQVVVAGPIVGVLAGWLEGMLVGGASGAAVGGLVGALSGLGIPKEEIVKYEAKIESGEYMLLVTGSEHDVSQARIMLDRISHEVSMSIAV